MIRHYFPLFGLLVLAASWGWRQHEAATRIRRDIAALQPQAELAAHLMLENRSLHREPVDSHELRRLREERLELLRLRGDIGELRQAARQTLGDLERELHQIEQATENAQRRAGLVQARLDAEDRSREVAGAINGAVMLLQQAALRLDGAVPSTWAEVGNALHRPLPHDPATPPEVVQRQEQLRRFSLDAFERAQRDRIRLSDFEIIPTTQRYEPARFEANAGTLVLRERTPRSNLDGGWVRAYGFLGGNTDEVSSDSPDFAAWEREATARTSSP